MADTYLTVVAACQALLGDIDAQQYGATFLLKYVNLAQDKVTQEMRAWGVEAMRDEVLLANVVANTLFLDKATTPALPAKMIQPRLLLERPKDAAWTAFVPVILVREELPNLPQQPSLVYYKWQSSQLRFLGATQPVDLYLYFDKGLADFTTPTDAVAVADTTRAVALYACGYVAGSQDDAAAAASFNSDGAVAVDQIIQEFTHFQQRKPRRRRAYAAGRSR